MCGESKYFIIYYCERPKVLTYSNWYFISVRLYYAVWFQSKKKNQILRLVNTGTVSAYLCPDKFCFNFPKILYVTDVTFQIK